MKKKHPRFSMMDSGLVINPKWSYIGASPDDSKLWLLWSWKSDAHIVTVMMESLSLVKTRGLYWREIQMVMLLGPYSCILLPNSDPNVRMWCMDVWYCDFVVCTFPEGELEPNMHTERIIADNQFWSNCTNLSLNFLTHMSYLNF